MDYQGTLYICDECSLLVRIHVECETTTEPMAYCPVCGTRTLRHTGSVLASSLTGTHLDVYAMPLRTLMFQMWKAHLADTTRTKPTYSRFVDYAAAVVLSKGEDV
jgi:DNA-directed RNA polymerase subunit RPC12/RpoP